MASEDLGTRLMSVPGLLFTFALGLIIIWFLRRRSRNLPPGPWGLPIVGHLPFLTANPHLKLNEWAKTYGSVYSLQMGSRYTTVISTHKLAKEAMVNQAEDFAARPDFHSFQFVHGGVGVSFSTSGPQWKLHKILARNALRLFTQRRAHELDGQVVSEADAVIQELVSAKGPIEPRRSIHVATASVVFSICFEDGNCIRDNEFFMEVLKTTDEIDNHVSAGGNPIDMMPWTLPLFRARMDRYISLASSFDDTCMEIQKTLKPTWVPKQPRNLSDALFDIVEEMGEEELVAKGLSVRHILYTVTDVMYGGQTTVVKFLHWSLLYMVKFPKVQERVHIEIDQQLGSAKAPTYEDRAKMPYCEAVFYETLRHSDLVPFLLPHATSRACKFEGYDLPEGALIFFNMLSVLRDPTIWDNPHEFEPMRFIDPKTGEVDRNKTEQVSLFGLGKRRCLGEYLGKVESFIFFVRLLQRCNFSQVEGDNYTLDAEYGLLLNPMPYRVIATLRSE